MLLWNKSQFCDAWSVKVKQIVEFKFTVKFPSLELLTGILLKVTHTVHYKLRGKDLENKKPLPSFTASLGEVVGVWGRSPPRGPWACRGCPVGEARKEGAFLLSRPPQDLPLHIPRGPDFSSASDSTYSILLH